MKTDAILAAQKAAFNGARFARERATSKVFPLNGDKMTPADVAKASGEADAFQLMAVILGRITGVDLAKENA